MTITHIGNDADQQGENTTALTCDFSGISYQADDYGIIVAGIETQNAAGANLALSGATGWTKQIDHAETVEGRDRQTYVWLKLLGASENNVTLTPSTAQEHSSTLIVFRGVDTSVQLDVAIVELYGNGDATPINSAITPVTDNCALVLTHWASHNEITAAGAPATPSGMSVGPTVIGTGNNNNQQVVAYKEDVGSAATITPTAWTHTFITDTTAYSCYTIALRPVSDGVTLTDVLSVTDGSPIQ